MAHLHRAIHEGDQDTTAGLPDALQSEVHPGHATTLAGVEQMPLARKQGIRAC
jgi:hypothetical protein